MFIAVSWTMGPWVHPWWAVRLIEILVALVSVPKEIKRRGEEAPSMKAALGVEAVSRHFPLFSLPPSFHSTGVYVHVDCTCVTINKQMNDTFV